MSSSGESGAVTRTGRPRDVNRDRELIEATQDLLVEVGYDRLTIDAVAGRVGAGRATLYRRWPNKHALVIDAVAALHRPQPPPGTGSVRGDLMVLAGAYVGTDARRGAVIAGLLTAMSGDEQLRAAVSDTIGRPRLAEFAAVIGAGIQRGEVDPDCDVALISRVFPGLALHQVIGLGMAMDMPFAEQVIDTLLLPLLTGDRQTSSPGPELNPPAESV